MKNEGKAYNVIEKYTHLNRETGEETKAESKVSVAIHKTTQ